jgi:hypothetical protein
MYKKGRWVKLRENIKSGSGRVLTKGTVGITYGYRAAVGAPPPPPLLELHLVAFPSGETSEVVFISDHFVELVMSKAELPPGRAGRLPDNWVPRT